MSKNTNPSIINIHTPDSSSNEQTDSKLRLVVNLKKTLSSPQNLKLFHLFIRFDMSELLDDKTEQKALIKQMKKLLKQLQKDKQIMIWNMTKDETENHMHTLMVVSERSQA
jgi:REP element-mobilizing transposase RayT